MKGWYKDYCAKTGQFCDQVKSKDKILDQTFNLIAQVDMDHGTKDPKTGNELTYEVNQPGVEDKEEEEEEDTVFSEEEQRLVKCSGH